MSSMLEQAIVDAAALKEAALKNAEQQVLERYSKDIKEAVNALLEQEDLEDAPPMMAEPEPVMDEIPPAAAAGEKLCPCPDDEEVVELDLDNLMMQVDDEEPSPADAMDREGVAQELGDEEDLLGGDLGDLEMGDEEEEGLQLQEDIDIDESELIDLVEELVFDYMPQPSGNPTGLPVADLDLEQRLLDLSREIQEANDKKKDLQESLEDSRSENNKLRRTILKLKEKLDEALVSNARLIYTNRVLGDDSLNERQKDKIVEKISEARTIEEAKMIHEALQSAVAGTSKKEGPKSLNEAVSRQSTQVFSRRQRSETNQVNDQFFKKMQRLAGIKKN